MAVLYVIALLDCIYGFTIAILTARDAKKQTIQETLRDIAGLLAVFFMAGMLLVIAQIATLPSS